MSLQNPKNPLPPDNNQQISHQLILNYTSQTNLYAYFPSNLWTQTWIYFENSSYKYICESTNTFPYNAVLNKLKRAIITHSNFQIYPEVRKEIIRIFYLIFNNFVQIWAGNKQPMMLEQQSGEIEIEQDQEDKNVSFFEKFIMYYKRIQPRIKRVESILTIVLAKHTTNKQIRKDLHHILSKQMMNCLAYEQLVNQCLDLIDQYRNKNLILSPKSQIINPQQTLFLQKIQLLINTETFPYAEYIERSKKYYTQLLPKIPKKLEMFEILHNFIEKQIKLSRIIVADEEKVKRNEQWRISKVDGKECMVSVLCKEVVEQLYGDMIQYLDFLFYDPPKTDQSQQQIPQQKKIQILKYLWNFTKLLKKYKNNSQEEEILLSRLSEIVKDNKQYLNRQNLYRLVTNKQVLVERINICFDECSKFLNEVNNGIQYLVMENQGEFNQYLCEVILSANYEFPAEMSDAHELNNIYSTELFKLTPSKQHFIRKFQQEFSRYVISTSSQNLILTQQELFIKTIQKQCGYMLSKNIEKMLVDVWKDEKLVFYEIGKMKCRVLSPDWPEFVGAECRLVDELLSIQEEFQARYARIGDGENQKKTLKWVWQYGTITMQVFGIQSIFSEIQASIVILLQRSFRPMNSKQFSEILQFPLHQLQPILAQLQTNNIILYEKQGNYYQINENNTKTFNFKIHQKAVESKQKKTMARDYGIIIEAYIAKILKRRKSLQKTDLMKLLHAELKNYRPNLEELSIAIEKLCARQIITIEKTRGIIRYIQ